MTEEQVSSFWSNVKIGQEGECHRWTGQMGKSGYGVFSIKRHSFLSHRIVVMMYRGFIEDDLVVCHRCDNPECCNPKHLWMGTTSDNMRDKIEKGRHSKGEKRISNKLSMDKADGIRKLYQSGEFSMREIGAMYGVTGQNVDLILKNRIWVPFPA